MLFLGVFELILVAFYGPQELYQSYAANIQTLFEMTRNNDMVNEKNKARAIIEKLIKRLSLIPNKAYDEGRESFISAYGVFRVNGKDVLIRVSDHSTFLYNWIDRNTGVDLSASANYAITFIDKVPLHNKPNTDNLIRGGNTPVFVVRHYIYYCDRLCPDDVDKVVDACVALASSGVYTDPLETDNQKHCTILRHKTNAPTKNITSQVRKTHRKKKNEV